MQTIARQETQIKERKPGKTIQDLIKQMEPEIKKALPRTITPERFTRIVLSALSTTPQLAECTPKSFLGAMMTAAQLGLEPNTPLGQAYLIPYKNNKKVTDPNGKTAYITEDEVQFQLGYKGLIAMAYRGGEVETIQAHTVYEHDEFEYEYGLEPKLVHRPASGDRGNPVAYYAVFRTKSGGYSFEVMSMADVERHRDKFSKAAARGFSPWATNFDEMAKKTVLKAALKYAPMSTETAQSISADETIKTTISEDMFTQPDETITAEFADEPQDAAKA